MTDKEAIKALVEAQPDDATFDEILGELAFSRRVDRGLADVREGRVISDEQMEQRVRQWSR
jgi:predicted transcriptional regulator